MDISQSLAARRRARLLSIFLLCLFLLFRSINLAYVLTVPGYRVPIADLIGYAMLVMTYLISRTRFTAEAVAVLLVMFPLNVFSNVTAGTSLNVAVTVSFLVTSYILASIFLGPFWTGAYGYGINLLVILLSLLAPGHVAGFDHVCPPDKRRQVFFMGHLMGHESRVRLVPCVPVAQARSSIF